MNATALHAAYSRFVAAAEAAGPDTGRTDNGWTVAHVVAHVAANDELIAAFVRAAINAAETDYDNDPVWRTASVQAYIEGVGSWTGLLDRLRHNSGQVLDLTEKVDDAVAATPFNTRLVDGGIERVDGPVPLGAFLHAHAAVHLPAHTAQIASLRSPVAAPRGRRPMA